MHQEIVALRQVLKSAMRHGDISRSARHVAALQEQRQNLAPRVVLAGGIQEALQGDARAHAKIPSNKKYQEDYEELHDYVLFMVNTGLRPDESRRLRIPRRASRRRQR